METAIKASTLDEAKRILAALPFLLNLELKDSYEEWLDDWNVYQEKTAYVLVDGIVCSYISIDQLKGYAVKIVTLNEYLAEINHPWLKIGKQRKRRTKNEI